MWSHQFFLKKIGIAVAAAAILLSMPVAAAPRRSSYDEENNTLLREMNDSLADIKHQVNNHESEIRTFEEKLGSQELIMESVRDQLAAASQAQKEFLKDSSITLEGKMSTLEATTKGLVTDLKQLKTHANDSANAMGQYKQKLAELEKMIEGQNRHLVALETALKSVMEAMQAGDPATIGSVDKGGTGAVTTDASGAKVYKVQPGDTLEKIATRHGTTIKAIKDLNGMTTDRIMVGKNLKIP